MGSSTYPRGDQTRSSTWVYALGRVLLACGTWVEEMPLGSCCREIDERTSAVALEVASTMSLASSTWAWKALPVPGGGTLGSECCSAAGRSDHADGYQALGLGCSRRRENVPSVGLVGMRNPLRVLGLVSSRNCSISLLFR